MIMYTLHPTQHFTPELMGVHEALGLIDAMVTDGVDVHSRVFSSPSHEGVTVFWTCDKSGTVATLWEHSYAVRNLNVPPVGLAEESAVLQEADSVSRPETDAEYAVGE